jgi:uroporphyrinogen-III decarboxylase
MSPLSSPLIAPLASGLGIRITGTSMQDNIRNPGVQTASVMAFLERFPDVDILFPLMDTSIEARCLGCPSEFGDRVPVVTAHPFPDPDAVCGLAVPDPLSSTPMATSIEVASRLSRETGRKTASFVVGPVTLAAHLMGPTALVKTALRDPAGFGRVLDHCSWLIRPYAEALAAAGASHLVVLEPQLIFFSPAVYVRSARERIEGLCSGLPSPVLHVCGDTTRHLEELGRTANVEALSLDAAVDLPSALDMIP